MSSFQSDSAHLLRIHTFTMDTHNAAKYESLPQYEGEELNKPAKKCSILKRAAVGICLAVIALAATRSLSRQGFFDFAKWGFGCHSSFKGLPTHFTLPSGDKIPSVALGVWKAEPNQVGRAVTTALEAGYKHIDGAWIYRNEEEVGDALAASSVAREDVWLTSKLYNQFHAPEDVERALDDSLAKLKTDYLDLYIIHWPLALNKDGSVYNKELTENPYPTWQKLEEMVEKGKVRNIGLSNFSIRRLQNLTANPLKYQPAVNQVEINFWFPQVELLEWSKKNGLLLEAYSPLGSDGRVGDTLNVKEVKEIAQELGITPAQVIISWHVQRGTVVLPKSVTPSRVEENLHITKLPRHLFEKLEAAARAHPPQRGLNPSKNWGLDFDIFE